MNFYGLKCIMVLCSILNDELGFEMYDELFCELEFDDGF